MNIPKKDIKLIYQELLKEGVMVCKKDARKPKHDSVDVPNLHVMCVMKSLCSRGFVTELFSWQWCYFTLTDEGIAYLRAYLHAPETLIPLTLQGKPATERREGSDRRSSKKEQAV